MRCKDVHTLGMSSTRRLIQSQTISFLSMCMQIGSRSSVYSPESTVRKTGSYIYEEFMPTDGTDVKVGRKITRPNTHTNTNKLAWTAVLCVYQVYTVGPDYAHAEARKSPALDGKVERDSEGKEIRYPVMLTSMEKLVARKVCMAFKVSSVTSTLAPFQTAQDCCRSHTGTLKIEVEQSVPHSDPFPTFPCSLPVACVDLDVTELLSENLHPLLDMSKTSL